MTHLCSTGEEKEQTWREARLLMHKHRDFGIEYCQGDWWLSGRFRNILQKYIHPDLWERGGTP